MQSEQNFIEGICHTRPNNIKKNIIFESSWKWRRSQVEIKGPGAVLLPEEEVPSLQVMCIFGRPGVYFWRKNLKIWRFWSWELIFEISQKPHFFDSKSSFLNPSTIACAAHRIFQGPGIIKMNSSYVTVHINAVRTKFHWRNLPHQTKQHQKKHHFWKFVKVAPKPSWDQGAWRRITSRGGSSLSASHVYIWKARSIFLKEKP